VCHVVSDDHADKVADDDDDDNVTVLVTVIVIGQPIT
jgi:hypothetical protein